MQLKDPTAPRNQEVPESIRELQAEEAQVGVLAPVSSDRTFLDAFLRAAVTPSAANIAALGDFANTTAGFIDEQPPQVLQTFCAAICQWN